MTENTNLDKTEGDNEKNLISLIIKNVKGSLSKITTFCAENNINIERLVLSNFKTDNKQHKVIMYVSGERTKINALISNFKKIDVVVKATNFLANQYLERELMLVKINTNNKSLATINNLANDYNGRTILVNDDIIIFQFTNDEETNDELMKKLEDISEDIEILKSGVVAISLDTKK
ncbi:MAG TPA: acetolactate synthase small subunit [Rickettsiales bacterium]|nr:acetolactate synthase small subunit [Rickettsiales bacterium]